MTGRDRWSEGKYPDNTKDSYKAEPFENNGEDGDAYDYDPDTGDLDDDQA